MGHIEYDILRTQSVELRIASDLGFLIIVRKKHSASPATSLSTTKFCTGQPNFCVCIRNLMKPLNNRKYNAAL